MTYFPLAKGYSLLANTQQGHMLIQHGKHFHGAIDIFIQAKKMTFGSEAMRLDLYHKKAYNLGNTRKGNSGQDWCIEGCITIVQRRTKECGPIAKS